MFWKKKTVGGVVNYGNASAISDKYNAGVGFLQAGNLPKAIDVFSSLVDANHPSAIYNLALLYTQGHGERLMLLGFKFEVRRLI
jgi:TPR repeat protein